VDGFNRTQLIETLAINRVSHLNVLSKVYVLDGIQRLKLSANVRGDYWAQNIIINTKQDQLSQLKTMSDNKGDYYNMHKLIYNDILSKLVRKKILGHFQTEARKQASHMALRTARSKLRATRPWRKILSDVDDTLVSSGGSFPAGCDRRYAKKVLYPGVLAFYRELDLGVTGPDDWQDDYAGNLTFLSARPHVYKDYSEKKSFEKFRRLRERGMHSNASLLAGDIESGAGFVTKNDFGALATKKAQNFREFSAIYPEYKYVFVGDNGQGDLAAGESMYEHAPDRLEALYVQVVQDRGKTYGYDPDRWRRNGLAARICFFENYPDAALDAAHKGLIRPKGVRRVCQAAVRDFLYIDNKKWPGARHKLERRAENNQGIFRANQYLEGCGEETSEYIRAERIWQDGQFVRTPFGLAVVRSFDNVWNMYEVVLDWRPLDNQVASHNEKQLHKLKTQMDLNPIVPLSSASKNANGQNDNGVKHLETVMEFPELEDNPTESKEEIEDDLHDLAEDKQEKHADAKMEYSGEDQMFDSPMSFDTGFSSSENVNHERFTFAATTATADLKPEALRDYRITFNTNIKTSNNINGEPTQESNDKHESAALPPPIDTSEDPSTEKPKPPGMTFPRNNAGIFYAKIHCRCISQYSPPSLPIIKKSKKEGGGLFKVRSVNARPASPKTPEFPHDVNSLADTPFGHGKVFRPLPRPPKGVEEASTTAMVGIYLTSWTLADGSHPKLYCTSLSMDLWKQQNPSRKKTKGNIASVFALVSKTVRRIAKSSTVAESKAPERLLFKRYYKDGAIVMTPLGYGQVQAFRQIDGFYVISLVSWTMVGSCHPVAYYNKDSLSDGIAAGCHERYPVLTSLNLTGILISVEPTTGVHIVSIVSVPNMICYLQCDHVLRPIKAAVGENVLTPYGEGIVMRYNVCSDTYKIKFAKWDAAVYCKGEGFDRVAEGNFNSGFSLRSMLGLGWLLGNMNGDEGWSQRSRSNSVTSAYSSRSHTS